jgi:hypothetical protein
MPQQFANFKKTGYPYMYKLLYGQVVRGAAPPADLKQWAMPELRHAFHKLWYDADRRSVEEHEMQEGLVYLFSCEWTGKVTYKGGFKDGKRHGRGNLTARETMYGPDRSDLRSGRVYGDKTFERVREYNGYWSNDVRDGSGTLRMWTELAGGGTDGEVTGEVDAVVWPLAGAGAFASGEPTPTDTVEVKTVFEPPQLVASQSFTVNREGMGEPPTMLDAYYYTQDKLGLSAVALADKSAREAGLQRVGWLICCPPRDYNLRAEEVLASSYQQLEAAGGYQSSLLSAGLAPFVTVRLTADGEAAPVVDAFVMTQQVLPFFFPSCHRSLHTVCSHYLLRFDRTSPALVLISLFVSVMRSICPTCHCTLYIPCSDI